MMARIARQHANGGIYHVILRGVNQQDIFEDDDDRRMFVTMLAECCFSESGDECMRVYQYCLMTNHVHILCREILTAEDEAQLQDMDSHKRRIGISSTMHRLGRKYAMYFNKRHGRIGTLFQDRFNSEPVEDNTYFLTVFRYIARNPLKAGIVSDPNDYPWSSWQTYLSRPYQSWISMKAVLSKWTLENLDELIHTEVNSNVMDFEDVRRPTSDAELKAVMREVCGGDTVAYVQTLPREAQLSLARQMKDAGGGWKQIGRMTGLTVSVIRTACGYVIPSHKKK